MKPVYMVHEKHGVHIAYDAHEVERCKKNGWKVREEQPAETKKRGRKKAE